MIEIRVDMSRALERLTQAKQRLATASDTVESVVRDESQSTRDQAREVIATSAVPPNMGITVNSIGKKTAVDFDHSLVVNLVNFQSSQNRQGTSVYIERGQRPVLYRRAFHNRASATRDVFRRQSRERLPMRYVGGVRVWARAKMLGLRSILISRIRSESANKIKEKFE